MKKITNYIQEKLRINKDTKPYNSLDIVFKDIDEFAEILTSYFGDKLHSPIYVSRHKTVFSNTCYHSGCSKQEVSASTYITFKDKDYPFIRCGLVMGGKRLLMQVGHHDGGTGPLLYDEKMTEFNDGYNFGKDNFEDWLEKIKFDYPELVKKFNI